MTSPDMSFRWDMFDDRGDLVEFTKLLEELDALMKQERAAVAKLDSAGLDQITERKQAVADSLAGLQARVSASTGNGDATTVRPNDPEIVRLRRSAAIAAQRVAAGAQANAMLLADAVDSVARMLGLGGEKQPSSTYDRNARRTGARVRTNRPGRAA